jgi:hypothetical protein
MQLGFKGDYIHKGKALIPGVAALKQADYEDYWPVDLTGVNHESTQQRDYKAYSSQQIEKFNKIDAGTLNSEKLMYFQSVPKIEDRKGHVLEVCATK